ncbi:MAG: AAA family ATPase [Actinomycetota bacterium]
MSKGTADRNGRLDVRLLGDVVVKLDGVRIPGFDSPRLQRLLAQLCVEGGISRTRMAFDLWPDSSEAQARGNLRKLLYDLKRVLPDAVRFAEFGQQALRWRSGANLRVDLVEFRAALRSADPAAAVAAYGGDLLPACYDDWVVAERDRLRAQALEAVLELASGLLEAGSYEQAARYARRALEIDSLAEPSYRLLMQAHAGRGDRAEGLRTYHRCAELLREHIGVEPQPATRAAYEALLATGSRSAPASTRPAPTPPATPLVGRSAELAGALHAWREAAAGRAGLLLVEGEPGIGKTRLAEEVARRVSGEGFAVARARAYRAAGRPAWGPVVDWLRAEAVQPALGRLDAARLAEVGRLVPELRSAAPPAPADSIGKTARLQLLSALSEVFLGGARPILLVLDDLQWCDRETVEWMAFALRAHPSAPALVLATVRTEELEEDHPVNSLRFDVARDGYLTEIPLGRLDAGSTAELARRVAGGTLDEEAIQRLWKDTEGMPLFVVEAVRTGLGSGSSQAEITPTVKAVISARLAKLSPTARRLVEVAATVGRSFSVEVLAATGSMDGDALVDALDELWRRQIIREQAGAYDFSHEKIREVAYGLIAPERRRSLHGKVAAALSDVQGRDQVLAGAVAVHYEQSGQLKQAVAALLAAGRRSVEVFALEDALEALRHGLLLLEQLPAGRHRDETELALRTALGVPLVALQGYGSDAVQDVYQRGMALCERLGRRVDPEVLRGLGLASLMSCRFDRSSRFADQLLMQEGADPTAGPEGHYLMGVSAFWRGDLPTSSEHLGRAIESFRTEHASDHLLRYGQNPKAVCLVRLAMTNLWMGKPDAARRLVAEALDYSRELDHPTTEGYVRLYAGLLAAEREEPDELARHLSAGEAVWSEQKLGYFQAVAELLRGWHSAFTGAPTGLVELEAVVSRWRAQDQTLHFSYGLVLLARAQLRAGQAEAGRATVEEGVAWSLQHDQCYLEAEFRRIAGELIASSGWDGRADASLREAVRVARSQGCGWFALSGASSLARLSPQGGGRALLEQALESFEGGTDLASVRRAKALAGLR